MKKKMRMKKRSRKPLRRSMKEDIRLSVPKLTENTIKRATSFLK